jgi:hypothetical protein
MIGKRIDIDGEKFFLIPQDEAPRAMAELFCELDAGWQAKFFDEVGNISTHWGGAPAVQWETMVRWMSREGEKTLTEMAQFVEA